MRVKSISLIYTLLVCNDDVHCEYNRAVLLGFWRFINIHWLLQNEDQEELKPTTTPGDQII